MYTKGTYVCCNFNLETSEKIAGWCIANNIPAPLEHDKYHTTILYSRKPVEAVDIVSTFNNKMDFSVIGFKLFDFNEEQGAALVLELDAPQLKTLHETLIEAGGTHDYGSYTPHLTVSYHTPNDLDVTTLKLPDFKVTTSGFSVEPLNLNWKD